MPHLCDTFGNLPPLSGVLVFVVRPFLYVVQLYRRFVGIGAPPPKTRDTSPKGAAQGCGIKGSLPHLCDTFVNLPPLSGVLVFVVRPFLYVVQLYRRFVGIGAPPLKKETHPQRELHRVVGSRGLCHLCDTFVNLPPLSGVLVFVVRPFLYVVQLYRRFVGIQGNLPLFWGG